MPTEPSASPRPFPSSTLRIEKLVYGGDGLARQDGRVVLIPFVLPGELVEAEVRRAKNDLFRGRALEILEKAESRADPPCEYFSRCGGCHYQHATYAAQVEQKLLIFREVLQRVGRIQFDGEIRVITGQPLQYRNRTQLHIANGGIGYFASGSHELVPIQHCPISSPKLNEAIAVLSRDLPLYRWFRATVELFTNEQEVQVNLLDPIPGSVRAVFDAIGTAGPIEYSGFRVSRNSFFQVNRFLVGQLVELVTACREGGSAVDLYSGVGLFARALATRFGQVTAVEPGSSAYRDLELNTAGSNVTPVKQNTEQYLAGLNEAPDLMVADPPRSGLGKTVIAELRRLQPRHLTVVSCDPATLARDLRPLLEGGYAIEEMSLVDLFPQTYHLESVTRLVFSR